MIAAIEARVIRVRDPMSTGHLALAMPRVHGTRISYKKKKKGREEKEDWRRQRRKGQRTAYATIRTSQVKEKQYTTLEITRTYHFLLFQNETKLDRVSFDFFRLKS